MKKSFFQYCMLFLPVFLFFHSSLLFCSAEALIAEEPLTVKETVTTDENTPSLQLSESSLKLVKGKTVSLKPTVVNGDGKKVSYTWESSNSGVAKVSSGKILAVDGGKATIICKAFLPDGSSVCASTEVTVTVPVKSLKLIGSKNITMEAGKNTKIAYKLAPENATVQALEWISSDPNVVWVDANGLVTAVSAGKAIITATTKDESKKSIQISVYVPSLFCPVNSVMIDKEDGEAISLKYFGLNWDENIEIKSKGDAFDYSIQKNGSDVLLQLKPSSVGSGSITIQDKNDKGSKITVKVLVELSAIPFYQYVSMSYKDTKNGSEIYRVRNNTNLRIKDFTFQLRTGEPSTFGFSLDAGAGDDMSFFGRNFEYALSEIYFDNGTILRVDENSYMWYSGKTDALISKEAKKQEVKSFTLDKTTRNYFSGFSRGYYFVNREWADYRGFQNTGMYIFNDRDGGLLAGAGISNCDLVFAADGVTAAEDLFFFEKAVARIAHGESVIFSVERQETGIMNYRFTSKGGKLTETNDFSAQNVSASKSLASTSTSILDDLTVKSLISSCPSIGMSTKSTKEFYDSLSEYNKDFPGSQHSWRISVQTGTIYFADENRMTVLLYKSKGTLADVAASLSWQIQLLDALPAIQKSAKEKGASLYAEKRAPEGDYAQFADYNGIIDLLNSSKREQVRDRMQVNKRDADQLYSIGQALAELDTNGNGIIDTYELFNYGD